MQSNENIDYFSPPPGVKIYRSRTSEGWVRENGVVCTRHLPIKLPISLEEMMVSINDLATIANGNKLLIITNIDESLPTGKEARDYAALHLPPLVAGMAMVCTKPLARMGAKIFFGLKPQPYPNRVFSNPIEGEQWLLSLEQEWKKTNG